MAWQHNTRALDLLVESRGRGWGAFTGVGWQIARCDPIWQVMFRNSEMGSYEELYALLKHYFCLTRFGWCPKVNVWLTSWEPLWRYIVQAARLSCDPNNSVTSEWWSQSTTGSSQTTTSYISLVSTVSHECCVTKVIDCVACTWCSNKKAPFSFLP